MAIETSIYEHPALAGVDRLKLPGHMLVIPDGNDTYARREGISTEEGHALGGRALIDISSDLGQIDEIKVFTAWSISSQNIDNRDPGEIGKIMDFIAQGLTDDVNIEDLMANETRLLHLGRKTRLTPQLKDALDYVEDLTRENKKHIICLLIDYDGDFELETIIEKARELSLSDARSSRQLSRILPVYRSLPPLDLIVRTKGNERLPEDTGKYHLSNLGPIVGESVIYSLRKLWPEATIDDMLEVIADFTKTKRNLGGRPK